MHILRLKRALDKKTAPVPSQLIVTGDINNVGMNLTYRNRDFSGNEELERYQRRFARAGLRLVPKSSAVTFWNGTASPSAAVDLDHLFASEALRLPQFSGGAEVLVRGWPELSSPA